MSVDFDAGIDVKMNKHIHTSEKDSTVDSRISKQRM